MQEEYLRRISNRIGWILFLLLLPFIGGALLFFMGGAALFMT